MHFSHILIIRVAPLQEFVGRDCSTLYYISKLCEQKYTVTQGSIELLSVLWRLCSTCISCCYPQNNRSCPTNVAVGSSRGKLGLRGGGAFLHNRMPSLRAMHPVLLALCCREGRGALVEHTAYIWVYLVGQTWVRRVRGLILSVQMWWGFGRERKS